MGQLLFKKRFVEAIRAGEKTTTIRRWPTCRLNAGERVFSQGIGYLIVESAKPIDLKRLRRTDARADGFETLAELREALHAFYPEAQKDRDGCSWFRIK